MWIHVSQTHSLYTESAHPKIFHWSNRVNPLKIAALSKGCCFSNDAHIFVFVYVWNEDFKINLCPRWERRIQKLGKPHLSLLFISMVIIFLMNLSVRIISLVPVCGCSSVMLSYVNFTFLHFIMGVKFCPYFYTLAFVIVKLLTFTLGLFTEQYFCVSFYKISYCRAYPC